MIRWATRRSLSRRCPRVLLRCRRPLQTLITTTCCSSAPAQVRRWCFPPTTSHHNNPHFLLAPCEVPGAPRRGHHNSIIMDTHNPTFSTGHSTFIGLQFGWRQLCGGRRELRWRNLQPLGPLQQVPRRHVVQRNAVFTAVRSSGSFFVARHHDAVAGQRRFGPDFIRLADTKHTRTRGTGVNGR